MRSLGQKALRLLAVTVGWWLSPLTWWNDLFVNLPIAWLVASVFARENQTALLIGVNLVYWATNVLGFLLMHWGGCELFRKSQKSSATCILGRQIAPWVIPLLWGVAYSALVSALILAGIIKPLALDF